jgi:DNA-binding LacI/PurR family transcriptional regulator
MKAFNATVELMKGELRSTAIYSFNSKMMSGTIRALQSLKITIPDDISLLCFDQIPGYEIFQPKITCIVQSIRTIGENSIEALINKIKRTNGSGIKMILEPELVIGTSCRAI